MWRFLVLALAMAGLGCSPCGDDSRDDAAFANVSRCHVDRYGNVCAALTDDCSTCLSEATCQELSDGKCDTVCP